MRPRTRIACGATIALAWVISFSSAATAQQADAAPTASPAQPAPISSTVGSHLFFSAGMATITVRGDCQTCEQDFPYRHGPGIFGSVGYQVTPRMKVGAEVFWGSVEAQSEEQHFRATQFDAVAQFRPWSTKGFFIKGGAGMTLVRNFIDVSGEPITSKALSVVIGGGWEFRPDRKVGYQLFAAQHAVALGDLITPTSEVQDVLANFWSLGAAIVIR